LVVFAFGSTVGVLVLNICRAKEEANVGWPDGRRRRFVARYPFLVCYFSPSSLPDAVFLEAGAGVSWLTYMW